MIENNNTILISFTLRHDNEKTKVVECIIQNENEQYKI